VLAFDLRELRSNVFDFSGISNVFLESVDIPEEMLLEIIGSNNLLKYEFFVTNTFFCEIIAVPKVDPFFGADNFVEIGDNLSLREEQLNIPQTSKPLKIVIVCRTSQHPFEGVRRDSLLSRFSLIIRMIMSIKW
jgi:hypothetical protein